MGIFVNICTHHKIQPMLSSKIPTIDIRNLSDFGENDLLINRFSDYLQIHPNLFHAHRHTFYHLVMFTKGGGFHQIDFNSFTVQPFQIYFMTPGQVHSWSFEGEMDGYVVNFSKAFFQAFLLHPNYLEMFSFFGGIAQDSVINLPSELQQNITQVFEKLLTYMNINVDMIRVLLLEIFLTIHQHSNTQRLNMPLTHNYTLLKKFQKLIDSHFHTLKLPKEYADLLYITPKHLNALCKEHTGLQAGELIRNRIILEAKRLLVIPDLSISEISDALNFSDNSYFSKFFKKQVRISPEEFRRKSFTLVKIGN